MWSLESRPPEDRTGDIATPASPANGPSPVDFPWWIYPRHNFHLSDSRLARNGVSGEKLRKNELYTYIQKERKRLCNFVWCNLNGSKKYCISKHVNWDNGIGDVFPAH